MVTQNSLNQKTAASGKVLMGQGDGVACDFSTATYPSIASTASNAIISDGTNFVSTPITGAVYGDGSDGNQTFDGTSVVLGITPSSSTYTLARDILLSAGTINSGVTITANGYRIFCSGTFTNNGTIKWDGNNASGASRGNSIQTTNSSFNQTVIGTAGATGTTGAGAAGTASSATQIMYGGQGGSGGSGTSGSGGAGGTVSKSSDPLYSSIRFLPFSQWLYTFDGNGVFRQSAGGTGGGSGSGDGVNSGGGGGGGGGAIGIFAQKFAGTGTISAKGGNGGSRTAGNCGGGGGGGGGFIVIISSSVVSGAISGQTLNVSGGTAGTSSGTGGAASNGNGGTTILLSY